MVKIECCWMVFTTSCTRQLTQNFIKPFSSFRSSFSNVISLLINVAFMIFFSVLFICNRIFSWHFKLILDAGQGVEPRSPESESGVLPLDEPATLPFFGAR